MKTKANQLSRTGLTVLEISSVTPNHPSDDFPEGKPLKGTRAFIEYWQCSETGPLGPYTLPFRIVVVDAKGKHEEIEYGIIKRSSLPDPKYPHGILECFGFGRFWEVSTWSTVSFKSRPKLIPFDPERYVMPPGPLQIAPYIPFFERPKAQVIVTEVKNEILAPEDEKPADEREITKPSWMKSVPIVIRPGNGVSKGHPGLELPDPEVVKQHLVESVCVKLDKPGPDEPMTHELASKANSDLIFRTFVEKNWLDEKEVPDYDAMKVCEVFTAWIVKNVANVPKLVDACRLDVLTTYNILRLKHLHPDLQKLLAPPTLNKDRLRLIQAGELARIQEDMQISVWMRAREADSAYQIMARIKELSRGHTAERKFSHVPKPNSIAADSVQEPPVPLQLGPQEQRAFDLVCKECGIRPSDFPLYPNDDDALHAKIRSAQQMLSMVLYDRFESARAKEIFLKLIGKASMSYFTNVHTLAWRNYRSDSDFRSDVDHISKEIIT